MADTNCSTPETRYVIHRCQSYVRIAQQGGRVLAALVRDSREATQYDSATAALLAAFESYLPNDWAIEAVSGRAS